MKSIFKKAGALILAVTMLFSLGACGGKRKPEEKPPEELAATPTVEVLPPQTPPDTQALEEPTKTKANVIEIHIDK